MQDMHAIAISWIPFIYFIMTTYTLIPQAQSNSLPLNMLSQINTTKSNIKTNASSLEASDIVVSCLDQVPGFLPVIMANYYAAVQQILLLEDALESRQYYLGPSREMRWEWAGGTIRDDHRCTIVLFNKEPLLTDAFPLVLIAHVGAMIADKCITRVRSYSGGWASAGTGRGIVAVMNSMSRRSPGESVSTERGLWLSG